MVKKLNVILPLLFVSGVYAQEENVWHVSNASTLNTEYHEAFSSITADGLSIYISSDRPGGFGPVVNDVFWAVASYDIYVAHRETVNSPWGAVINLGERINTAYSEHSPMLSPDKHYLYFVSARLDGENPDGGDLYVSYRQNTADDHGWEPAVNLGSSVNTPWTESCPFFHESVDGSRSYLYFVQMDSPDPASLDIKVSELDRETGAWGHPETLAVSTGLGDGHFDAAHGYIRGFDYPGGYGASDIWLLDGLNGEGNNITGNMINAGADINTEYEETMPSLTENSNRMFLNSDRPDGLGGFDIYEATRLD